MRIFRHIFPPTTKELFLTFPLHYKMLWHVNKGNMQQSLFCHAYENVIGQAMVYHLYAEHQLC